VVDVLNGAANMNDDDFSVTMKTSLHRREAWPLVIEGYRLIAGAIAAQGRRLLARMRRSLFQVGRRERNNEV
jgi:hypothetical protein